MSPTYSESKDEENPKDEAACPSETSIDLQRTALGYILEDGVLHAHRYENLQSYTILCVSHVQAGRIAWDLRLISVVSQLSSWEFTGVSLDGDKRG
jgi:hypothetical protein